MKKILILPLLVAAIMILTETASAQRANQSDWNVPPPLPPSTIVTTGSSVNLVTVPPGITPTVTPTPPAPTFTPSAGVVTLLTQITFSIQMPAAPPTPPEIRNPTVSIEPGSAFQIDSSPTFQIVGESVYTSRNSF